MKDIVSSTATPKSRCPCTDCVSVVVPYLSNPDFIRRREPFEELKTQLGYGSNCTDGTSQYRVSLFGLGGVGKTQIAIAFVYWLRQTHPGVSVFWVHASTTERFQQAYTSFAQQFLLVDEEDPGQDRLELVKLWLERKYVGRWLLVIDNADDAEIFFRPKENPSDNLSSSTKPLASYIPKCSHVSVLVTTRNKQTGLRLTHQRRSIAVGKMDDIQSQQLLSEKLNDSTSEDRQKLAARLESLPLALAQAAAFIQANCISTSEYIKLLDETPAEVLDIEFEAPGRGHEIPHAVMQTWKISFEEIKRQNPLASDLLSFMGLVDCQAIPREFLTHYVKSYHPEPRNTLSIRLVTALGVLKAYSFVAENKSSNLDMHRLVHLSTQRWLEEREEMYLVWGQALQTLAQTFPDSDWDKTLDRCDSYIPHICAVMNWDSSDHQIQADSDHRHIKASLCFKLAGYAYYYRSYAFAEGLSGKALGLRMSLPGDENTNGILQAMARIVWIHIRQGKLESAQETAQLAYEISQTVSGAQSQQTLMSMSDLGAAYAVQDRYEEAEELRIRILETARKIGGLEMEPDTLASMSNLAAEYLAKERLEEAEGLQMEVVQLREDRGLGEDHPETISGIDLLSRIYETQNRYEEALTLLLRVLEAEKRESGDDCPKTIALMMRLTLTCAALDLSREFADNGWKGIAAAKRRWGEDDSKVLTFMALVASTYSLMLQLHKEGLELWLQVFRRMTRMPGHHHRDTLAIAARQVDHQFEDGLDKEALELGLELFETSRIVLGEEDTDTLAIITTISSTHFKAERYEECLEWVLKDVEAQRKVMGEDHAEISRCLLQLAMVQGRLGRFEEAVAVAEEYVALPKRVLGPDYVKTLEGMLCATMCRFQGVVRYKEALLLIQQVLEAAERTLGPDHDYTIIVRQLVDSWSGEAERGMEGELPGASTLATSKDQKDVQETPLQEIEDTQMARSNGSTGVEGLRGTPSNPGTELSAAPRPEPGEKERRCQARVANTSLARRRRQTQRPPRRYRESRTSNSHQA